MAALISVDQLPQTSADMTREFSDRYAAGATVEASDWAMTHGDIVPSASPDRTYPLDFGVVEYAPHTGENSSEDSAEGELRLQVQHFDAAHDEQLLRLRTNPIVYSRWLAKPQQFLQAEQEFVNRKISGLLAAGASTACQWDGENFFSTAHLANPADESRGTFSNYESNAKDPADIDNIETEVTAYMQAKKANGEVIGRPPKFMLLSTARYERVKNVLGQQIILRGVLAGGGDGTMGAVTNPYQGGALVPVNCPELSGNDWYLVGDDPQALPPWAGITFKDMESMSLAFFDEQSDYFKKTKRLKVISSIFYAFALAFPHSIRKVVGA